MLWNCSPLVLMAKYGDSPTPMIHSRTHISTQSGTCIGLMKPIGRNMRRSGEKEARVMSSRAELGVAMWEVVCMRVELDYYRQSVRRENWPSSLSYSDSISSPLPPQFLSLHSQFPKKSLMPLRAAYRATASVTKANSTL